VPALTPVVCVCQLLLDPAPGAVRTQVVKGVRAVRTSWRRSSALGLIPPGSVASRAIIPPRVVGVRLQIFRVVHGPDLIRPPLWVQIVPSHDRVGRAVLEPQALTAWPRHRWEGSAVSAAEPAVARPPLDPAHTQRRDKRRTVSESPCPDSLTPGRLE